MMRFFPKCGEYRLKKLGSLFGLLGLRILATEPIYND